MKTKKNHKYESQRKRQFCTFHIGGRLFGVDILDVKEINTETTFTPIYHAPKEVKGYVNIRGQIHLIIDLRLIMGFEEKPIDSSSRLILFKQKIGESFGILVDKIGDILEVDEAKIEDRRKEDRGAPTSNDRRSSEISSGICMLEKQLLIILNSRKLLQLIEKKA